jgi:dTDP-4-amino-4,6-dideoxygalactose transaminase
MNIRTMSDLAPANSRPHERIPVLRPQLPKAQALLPYLERIDASRIYSNWGPLVSEFSQRLAQRFAVPASGVVCASSGMAALMGAILANAGFARPGRDLAIVPDYTFTATALAVQMCGYRVVLASCHHDTWIFEAGELLARPDRLAGVGLVVPVAPFGRPVAQLPWQEFQSRTGVPVVIDAAACFESFTPPQHPSLGALPVALSFHATKSFGVGEGGCVVTTDERLAAAVLRALNFGFHGSRDSTGISLNGKMPEYTAAVGLAELDGWDAKCERAGRVLQAYREAFRAHGLESRLRCSPDISSSYVLLQCDTTLQAESVVETLAGDNIETRFWYGLGLGRQPCFQQAPRLDLHGKAAIEAGTVPGLPTAVDLAESNVKRVVASVASALCR